MHLSVYLILLYCTLIHVHVTLSRPAVHNAITGVNQAIVGGSLTQLLHSLQCEDTRLNAVYPDNVQWYMDVLSKAIKDKAEVQVHDLPYEHVHEFLKQQTRVKSSYSAI